MLKPRRGPREKDRQGGTGEEEEKDSMSRNETEQENQGGRPGESRELWLCAHIAGQRVQDLHTGRRGDGGPGARRGGERGHDGANAPRAPQTALAPGRVCAGARGGVRFADLTYIFLPERAGSRAAEEGGNQARRATAGNTGAAWQQRGKSPLKIAPQLAKTVQPIASQRYETCGSSSQPTGTHCAVTRSLPGVPSEHKAIRDDGGHLESEPVGGTALLPCSLLQDWELGCCSTERWETEQRSSSRRLRLEPLPPLLFVLHLWVCLSLSSGAGAVLPVGHGPPHTASSGARGPTQTCGSPAPRATAAQGGYPGTCSGCPSYLPAEEDGVG
nr:PREDICTED: uncharacterized protein LOC107076533 [Lepisosteus oculatus]